MVARARSSALANCHQPPGLGTWQEAGPSNVGGRMTSLVVHPTDPDRLVAGAAGGGVWTSTTGGKDWA